jgi:Bacterial Ig domain/IPT/TIG domain/Viral BACON domain
MSHLSASRPENRRFASILHPFTSGRLLILCAGLMLAAVFGMVVVRSADLSDPFILPGDMAVAPAPGNQYNPHVARGGNQYLAVWVDNRTVINGQISGIGSPTNGTGRGTLDDIYAARLDANGNALDTIIVAGGQYNQGTPRVGWNGQNWLVAWQTQQETNPFNTQIRAARVSPDGTVLDAVPLLIYSGDSNSPAPSAVISDGSNWIVMWEGFPAGSSNRSVFVSRVSPAGVVLDPDGKEAFQHSSQFLDAPDIAFGGNGFLVTFVDLSAGPNFENVLKGIRLDLNLDQNGNVFKISPTGFPVGSAKAKLAFNGQYYMAVWENGYAQTSGNKLVGSRISTGGQLIDGSPIQIVANMDSYAPRLDICGDSTMWFASYNSQNGTINQHIRVARVTADGTSLDPDGISVLAGSSAVITIGVGGGAQVVFQDRAFDPTYALSHIFGARVSSAGVVGAPTNVSLGVPRQTRPRIAKGSNGYMAVFRSEAANDSRILAQRLDAAAHPIDAEPIVIASGSPTSANPSVAFNGLVYLVVWQTDSTGTASGRQILGRRVTPEGLLLDAVPFAIMTGEQPDVAALGDSFLVAGIIQATSQKRYVHYVRVSGLGIVQGTPTRVDFNFNFVPRVAAFGTRWLIVWEHHNNHDDSPGTIYGAFVEPDGMTLGAFPVGGTPGNDNNPHLAVAGNSALVVWSNGNILGRRINADGTFPDPLSGYTLVDAANLQALPAVAWDGAQYVLDWVDQRNESYPAQPRGDIYGARVSPTNITLEEFPIATSQLPEDTPFVIADNGLSIFAYAKFYDTAPYKSHRITIQTARFAPPDLGTIPAAPTNLVATEPNGNPNVNELTWTDNSNDERGFKIEYKIGATGAWSQIAVVGANVTTYSTSVNPTGAAYFYRVRSYGLAGDSAYSNEATPPNTPPTVAITAPADGATSRAPAQLTVSATAADSNGTITQVEFFNNNASWGKDTSAPYTVSRFNVPAGTYVLRAVATDNRGAMTTSAPVTVTVTPQNNNLIWSQTSDGQSIIGPSVKTQADTPPVNQEVADDFDIVGTVERVLMYGYRDFSSPRNPVVHGIYVRFYQWLNGAPGLLQSEQFIAVGSPNLTYDPADANFFDIQLPTAFTATGKHFISTQLVTDTERWYWASSRSNQPRNSPVYHRDNLTGGLWTSPRNSDGVFSLYGTLTGSPRLDALSATTIPRSGSLTLTGANFGGTQETSRVLIGGVPALIFSWGDSSIRLYVPEGASIGTNQVQVETNNGLSNALNLDVTQRQQSGRIKWRFTVNGGYVYQQAAIGPDGSVYLNDDEGRLYALTGDGGLKWIINAGRFGTDGHISVGSDGTIYVATGAQPGGVGTPFVGSVVALNPDGTQKWQFNAPESTNVRVGPDVGPDGKIYVIFNTPSAVTPTALNLVALAPEDGHLVWNYYDRYVQGATSGKYFTFNAQLGLLYFQGSSQTFNGGLYAHRMDNGNRVHAVSGLSGQAIVAPDQTVHNVTQSFTPQLALNWTFPLFGQGPQGLLQDVGPDSVHYLVQNFYRLYAVNPNGTEKWHFDDCVSSSSCRNLDEPVVSPANQVVFVPGLYAFGQPGFFLGVNPASGAEMWRVPLPVEPGFGEYGQVRPMNRAVFAPDGQTAYVSTEIAGGYDYAYFYAVDTSSTLPCSASISPLSKNFAANGGSGSVSVTVTTGTCSWTATSNANWITVNSGSGTGNGTVTYTVANNPTTQQRNGTINISGQLFTVTQVGVLPDSPVVNITYPANNQTFQQPTNVFVTADAAAAEGRTLARVEFYAGTTLIGSDASAPYQIVWNSPASTAYGLTARAIDNLGIATDSAPVNITLLPPSNPSLMPLPVPPPVMTSPQAEATFTAPATITIEATRQPSNYPTVRMEFYAGTTLLGTDTDAPYSFTWTDVPPGRYTISVRNVANTGARATTQPVDITVSGQNFNINGIVVNDDGVPLSGVTVVLNGSNFANTAAMRASGDDLQRSLATSGSFTVTTDANGNYTFANLPQGGNYTIAPSANGVQFVPAQAAFNNLHSDAGATFVAGGSQPQALRNQTSDFDGDRRTDLAVWQSDSGIWHIVKTTNGAQQLQQWGQASLGDLAAPGDYDGDGRTDIAIFRPADGNWYILQSSTGASTIQNWGQQGDRPVPADYDGDGKTDVAVFRLSEGNWYIKKSTGGSIAQGWGDPTDRLVPGDYDGDGRADIAVFRNSEGNWYILKSTGGSQQINWGLGADRAVPGDYDGDGVTDIAVFRPSEGNWYIKKSTGGSLIRNWGESADRPVPGDYDGDGKTDIAVWRPSEATWYIVLSGTNTVSVQYLGLSADIPVPAAFIPQ